MIRWMSGAEIRYTLTGQEPSASSTLYSAPVVISGAGEMVVTLKSVALKAGMANSGVLTAGYQIDANKVANVAADPMSEAEVFLEDEITLTSGMADAEIRYTKDRTDPVGNNLSLTYATPIAVAEEMHANGVVTIKAYAKKDGMTDSGTLTAVYQVKKVADIATTPVSGNEVDAGDKVSLATGTVGATVYYTTGGTEPTSSSTAYPADCNFFRERGHHGAEHDRDVDSQGGCGKGQDAGERGAGGGV
jgi:hypothetical protein